jgi:hypothetical protein
MKYRVKLHEFFIYGKKNWEKNCKAAKIEENHLKKAHFPG